MKVYKIIESFVNYSYLYSLSEKFELIKGHVITIDQSLTDTTLYNLYVLIKVQFIDRTDI